MRFPGWPGPARITRDAATVSLWSPLIFLGGMFVIASIVPRALEPVGFACLCAVALVPFLSMAVIAPTLMLRPWIRRQAGHGTLMRGVFGILGLVAFCSLLVHVEPGAWSVQWSQTNPIRGWLAGIGIEFMFIIPFNGPIAGLTLRALQVGPRLHHWPILGACVAAGHFHAPLMIAAINS